MSISLSQYIEQVKTLRNSLDQLDAPVRLASGSALFEFSKRVFTRGESSTGGKFQYNSTTPLYVNPAKTFGTTAGLRPPKGKTGQTKFKSGKAHKTTWVESYKALRGIVGRENSFVNWEAHGDLKLDLENNGTLTTRKVADATYSIQSTKKENNGKLEGFAIKYPGVFKLSEKEKQVYYEALEKEILLLIKAEL